MTAHPNDIVFYDGTCALCHALVSFTVKRDKQALFRFSPLQGEVFKELLSAEQRAQVPDSVVVLTGAGLLYTRSQAVAAILRKLGGFWAVCGTILSLIPQGVADMLYDVIAKIRYTVFGRKEHACPVVPAELRGRFL